jgi:hypothetical protein
MPSTDQSRTPQAEMYPDVGATSCSRRRPTTEEARQRRAQQARAHVRPSRRKDVRRAHVARLPLRTRGSLLSALLSLFTRCRPIDWVAHPAESRMSRLDTFPVGSARNTPKIDAQNRCRRGFWAISRDSRRNGVFKVKCLRATESSSVSTLLPALWTPDGLWQPTSTRNVIAGAVE